MRNVRNGKWVLSGALVAALAFTKPASAEGNKDDSRNINRGTPRTTSGKKEGAVAESLIRKRVEDLAKAVTAKDLDGAMSFYAPDIVSFDLNPPLGYAGADAKRRAWREAFAGFSGPMTYEVSDLNVMAQGDLAFVHSFNHVSSTLAGGQASDMWVRWTACFRRIDGVWLIVHDHVSVPADLEHGRAVLNLKP